MTSVQKIHLLYKLYKYRALGYEYIAYEHRPSIASNAIKQSSSTLESLASSMANCHLCPLSKCRKNVVFGEGNPKAELMFIGEGPGASEDETGKPFVGLAGGLLTKIIENVLYVKRSDVYIANVVKCRPPKNRVPTMEEVDACRPFLMEQIALVKPRIIVALGSTSYHHLTGEYDTKISQIRGSVIDFGGIKLVPTYHPSFLLRNPSAKKDVYHDMLKVKTLI